MAEGVVVRVPEVGTVLAGKYRLTRLIGEGGMGFVLEAEHLRLRQLVAIKFLNPTMTGTEEIVKRFDREARAAATLKSRHVVRVSDVEATPEGLPYIVMELLEGYDLESARESQRQMPYAELVDYVLQACSALGEAHDAGIVHRDLKPSNLFLAREAQDVVVLKVLDFGISKFLSEEESKLTSAGSVVGTVLYMSPEQIRGKPIDGRSDIWSMGVILYELLTGETPWTGSTAKVSAHIVSDDVPDIRLKVPLPDGLAATIHAMLAKPMEERPQTMAEVAACLLPFAPPGSIGAEVGAAVARRSTRNVITPPSSKWIDAASEARTLPQLAVERSTIGATTSAAGLPNRQRSASLIALALGALVTVGVVVVLYAFVWRAKPVAPPLVNASAPPPSASVQPAVASADRVAMPTTGMPPTPAVTEEPAPKVAPSKAAATTSVKRAVPAAPPTLSGVHPTKPPTTQPTAPPLYLP